MDLRRTAGRLAAVAALVTATACSGNSLGTLGDILGGAASPAGGSGSGQLNAEVRSVDTQQQRISVATSNGQTGTVLYDQNTVLVYRQQQYPMTALERGDIVIMEVRETAQGSLYASRIEVQQSVQERTGTSGGANSNVQQYSGRVGQMDYDRGLFTLQTSSGTVTVSLPYNAPQATVDYFRRLRAGDTVRLEAIYISSSRLELYRFL